MASGFQDLAALAVAASDLMVVQLIRGAIQAADIESGKEAGPLGIVPDSVILARRHFEPEPEFLPRRVIHPTPTYTPRPVIHPTPRLANECPPAAACPEEPPRHLSPGPCPPPWKQPFWKNPIPPQPIIKVTQYKTDIPTKGSRLDVFI